MKKIVVEVPFINARYEVELNEKATVSLVINDIIAKTKNKYPDISNFSDEYGLIKKSDGIIMKDEKRLSDYYIDNGDFLVLA